VAGYWLNKDNTQTRRKISPFLTRQGLHSQPSEHPQSTATDYPVGPLFIAAPFNTISNSGTISEMLRVAWDLVESHGENKMTKAIVLCL
jgi:hypothetical protein